MCSNKINVLVVGEAESGAVDVLQIFDMNGE